MLFELACLFFHARNNNLTFEKRADACSEVNRLAFAAGYSVNDLAKILIIREEKPEPEEERAY
jgi:hypothetical protein